MVRDSSSKNAVGIYRGLWLLTDLSKLPVCSRGFIQSPTLLRPLATHSLYSKARLNTPRSLSALKADSLGRADVALQSLDHLVKTLCFRLLRLDWISYMEGRPGTHCAAKDELHPLASTSRGLGLQGCSIMPSFIPC